jgi:hypothetical protein
MAAQSCCSHTLRLQHQFHCAHPLPVTCDHRVQVVVLNTADRDWRDILFDQRIIHQGRQLNHVYFNTTLPALQSKAPAPEAVSASGVPVLQLICSDARSQACTALSRLVDSAMGYEPANCAKRGGLVSFAICAHAASASQQLRTLELMCSLCSLLVPLTSQRCHVHCT